MSAGVPSETQQELPPGGVPEDGRAWSAWQPPEVADRLAGVRARWCVAGGWALDLFLDAQSREHEDLEIAAPAADFPAIRAALGDFEFYVVGSGHRWPVGSTAFAAFHQTWAWDRAARAYRLDVFREPHDGNEWICRRDQRIRRPYADVIAVSAGGIPFLAPELVLLFKAKHLRDKDEADFQAVLPHLDAAHRDWLATAVRQVHPGHPWLRVL